MLVTDRTLMRPQDPTLEKRGHPVDPRHQLVGLLFASGLHRHLAFVAKELESVVAVPPVRVENTARLDGRGDEAVETQGRGVLDVLEADPADSFPMFFRRHCNQSLFFSLTTRNPLFEAAEVRLIDLHRSSQAVPAWTDHCSPQPVQPRPGSYVGLEPADPLQPQGACTVLLARQVTDGTEPLPERLSSVLKEGTRDHGGLVAAGGTFLPDTTHRPGLHVATARTTEPLQPPQLGQVVPAGSLAREPVTVQPQLR